VKAIEIVVTPVNHDTRYEARVAEEFLGSFREPFLEVARVLRAEASRTRRRSP
jgi:hypothetical protein